MCVHMMFTKAAGDPLACFMLICAMQIQLTYLRHVQPVSAATAQVDIARILGGGVRYPVEPALRGPGALQFAKSLARPAVSRGQRAFPSMPVQVTAVAFDGLQELVWAGQLPVARAVMKAPGGSQQ
ncbi:hypothetical protein HaLaN_14953 [Haematococcus lacustris]|uniref:Uncharacterized protein n=1 Tax=Haematococcus lacustris TaxID=44745 RepID=A0A699ZH13_HAELA|nr:hypothetical protein HaLaN_14953 [Haematococcus lacustris]